MGTLLDLPYLPYVLGHLYLYHSCPKFEIVHSFTCLSVQNIVCMANSVDPDQRPHSAASDLDLHCLQRPICLRVVTVPVIILTSINNVCLVRKKKCLLSLVKTVPFRAIHYNFVESKTFKAFIPSTILSQTNMRLDNKIRSHVQTMNHGTAPDKALFSTKKSSYFSYFSMKTCCGTH